MLPVVEAIAAQLDVVISLDTSTAAVMREGARCGAGLINDVLLRCAAVQTTDAEVADIMITAFCSYLNTDAPADHRSASNVQAFEEHAYDAVFGGAPPESYSRQGWLYGN